MFRFLFVWFIVALIRVSGTAADRPSVATARLLSRDPEWRGGGIVQERLVYRSQRYRVKGKLVRPIVPKGRRLPTVILNHDGVGGISAATIRRARELAAAGYLVVMPSYRGEDGSEGEVEVAAGEVEDVVAAIGLVRELPEGDPARVALVGTSHGALISVLAACRLSGARAVRAVVAGYGVMDIFAWWDYLKREGFKTDDPLSLRVYGRGPEERPEAFGARNAVECADRLEVPVLIVQGGRDRIVPPDQAIRFREALIGAGKAPGWHLAPNAGHGFLIYQERLSAAELAESRAAWRAIRVFLRRHLAPRRERQTPEEGAGEG